MADDILFPKFCKALASNAAASQKLPRMTLFRYIRGELPATFELFFENPDLLEALAEDAREMTPEQFKRWKKGIHARGLAQKKYRKKVEQKSK